MHNDWLKKKRKTNRICFLFEIRLDRQNQLYDINNLLGGFVCHLSTTVNPSWQKVSRYPISKTPLYLETLTLSLMAN